MKYFLILSYCYMFMARPAIAQVFDQITVENGLSQSSVMAIAQDKSGMLWLGTRYGINRYDAKNLKVYTRSNNNGSLSEDYIISMFCDSKGALWAGTLQGLNRYNSLKDNFEQVSVALKDPHQNINCITENQKHQLLVGIYSSVWIKKADNDSPFKRLYQFSGEVKCVFESSNGITYIGTTKGLFEVPNNSKPKKSMISPLGEGYITSVTEDLNRNIWVGTNGDGLFKISSLNGKAEQFTHDDKQPTSLINNIVRKVLVTRNGSVWIGTQEGLSVSRKQDGEFINYQHDRNDRSSLSQNSIHSLYEDSDQTVWIGTFFGGVNRVSRYQTPFMVNRYGHTQLVHTAISSVVEDDDQNLWIGTEGNGLTLVNRTSGKAITYKVNRANINSISSNLVKVIFKDSDNNIWIGTHAGGLNLFDKKKGNFKRLLYNAKDPNSLNSEITSINEDRDGSLWVGSQRGVTIYKRNGMQLTPDTAKQRLVRQFDGSMILYIFKDSANQLWFGTESGLYRLNGSALEEAERPAGKSLFRVNSITQDSKGNIWVGSYYNGLHCYTGQGKVKTSFNSSNGLSDNNVVGVCEDNSQNLWISTGNGLCRYIPAEKRFLKYYANDGIAGNVFNNNSFYKAANGELLFGGYSGLTSFMPNAIVENKNCPNVLFSSLKLSGSTVSVADATGLLKRSILHTQSLTFAAAQNVFSIGISVLNFTRPEKNRFAYQLKGVDKTWKYVTDPSFSFNNLTPGNYVLLAKGSNNDGVWSKPIALKIEVLPPFWKTWVAYAIYLLFAAAILFFIVRYFFLREWVKKNEELTKYKLNFFTEISHEIRTHLALIIGPTDNLLQAAGKESGDDQQLQVIKNNSESLLQLVNELMDFRRAEAGFLKLHVSQNNITEFIKSIYTSFHSLSVDQNISSDLIYPNEQISLWFDPYQLEKVIYNLLSNAFKFTPDGGSIKVIIEPTPENVTIEITNSGSGIPEEDIDKVFNNFYQANNQGSKSIKGYGIGLAMAKSIIELHKGSITVSSKPNQFSSDKLTCFTLKLRKGPEHLSNYLTDGSTPKHFTTLSALPAIPAIAPDKNTFSLPIADEKPSLLLVEDNSGIRQLIANKLKEFFEISECENGLDGWQQATSLIPDIIISDVMMPGIDGIELCSRIKNDPRTSHIPVIMLTAKTAVENQIIGLRSGADIYMPKPFNIEVLTLAINNILVSKRRIWQYFEQSLSSKILKEEGSLSSNTELHPLDIAFLQKISDTVITHMMMPNFNIAELSSIVGMSQPVLSKKVKAITGLSTNDYVKSLRLQQAAKLLAEKRYTVYEISYMVGYDDSRYFSKEFKKHFGELPSNYMAKADLN